MLFDDFFGEFVFKHHNFLNQIMLVSLNSSTVGVTCGAGTANSYGAPEFTPGV
jgi:hypothetical protein